MTPEEEAVIDAAISWGLSLDPEAGDDLHDALGALFASRRPVAPDPVWTPAVFADCLAGDRIRIGQEETNVVRASRGIWHADTRDEWRPKAWDHLEVRLELAAVPGFQQYPPNGPIEILMTEERLAVHTMARAFPGSAVTR